MSRRSFRAEQIMSRYRPIAPKPTGSSSSRSAAVPARTPAANVYCINSGSRVCKKRSGSSSTSSRRGKSSTSTSPSSCISRTLVPKLTPVSVYSQALLPQHEQVWQCEARREDLKTLPLLPNTPAAHSSTSSPSESGTSTSSTEPAVESLTELSLRFGDTPFSRSHATSRTGSFTLSCGSTTELAPPAGSVEGKSFTANAAKGDFETRLFEQAYAACPEPVALTDERGGVVWCNPAYRSEAESSEELGLPVPLYCFGSGAILWVFWRKFFSPVGLPVCEPMKPLAVRASCENLLPNLKNQKTC